MQLEKPLFFSECNFENQKTVYRWDSGMEIKFSEKRNEKMNCKAATGLGIAVCEWIYGDYVIGTKKN